MHEQRKPLAADGGETRQSVTHGLAERDHASRSVVKSGTQHGSRLADSAQPSPSDRTRAGGGSDDLDGFRTLGGRDCGHASQPCEEERLASLGDAARQRRQPVHPQGQEDEVKPRGPVSTENVLRLLEQQRYRCALTGRDLSPEEAALDHIIPIRCDGEHVIENTQVLHKDVNRAKGSLTNEEFVGMCREVVDHVMSRNDHGPARDASKREGAKA